MKKLVFFCALISISVCLPTPKNFITKVRETRVGNSIMLDDEPWRIESSTFENSRYGKAVLVRDLESMCGRAFSQRVMTITIDPSKHSPKSSYSQEIQTRTTYFGYIITSVFVLTALGTFGASYAYKQS